MDRHFVFQTAGFIDSSETLAENINGIGGHALALYLIGRLKQAGMDVSEVWPEDHGWDFSVNEGAAKYLVSCSLEREGEEAGEGGTQETEAHVSLTKFRSMTDKLFGRNAFANDDGVAHALHEALAASPDAKELMAE